MGDSGCMTKDGKSRGRVRLLYHFVMEDRLNTMSDLDQSFRICDGEGGEQ